MPYTAQKPKLVPSRDVLERIIPDWGVDLDPANRPAIPKEHFDPQATGAHWDFPERQVPHYAREKSTEQKSLTPVFGTACPPKGLSGVIRRVAYRFSEGRLSHWLLLVFADRVDVAESTVGAILRGRPDNPITEIGLGAEIKRHGLRSRRGQHRTDLAQLPVDVLYFAARGIALGAVFAAVGGGLFLAGRRLRARR
jgi:hypothetical protein